MEPDCYHACSTRSPTKAEQMDSRPRFDRRASEQVRMEQIENNV